MKVSYQFTMKRIQKIQTMIQQQVEILRFEDINIKKLKQRAERTNKIRDWLALMKAYKENNQFENSDEVIQIMHYKFILREEFWLEEIQRKIKLEILDQKHIQFMFMALDDGFYQKVADTIYGLLSSSLTNPKDRKGTNLRANYVVAKIEKLIEIFKEEKNFFSGLRNYYKSINNNRKIRQLYLRQVKQGYDCHDVIYDQYCQWQTDQNQLQNSKKAYAVGKQAWQKKDASFSLLNNLNHPDRPHFDSTTYLKLIEQLDTETQKLRYLRIICLGRHELINEYLEKLELVHQEDEEYVKKCYEHIEDFIPEVEMAYLRFLVRRINKHVQTEQNQQYNNTWGEKVQHFRDCMAELINKPRLTPKTQSSIRELYYNYWIDVQTSLIKDKSSVCQLFQALLQIKNSVETYTKYSQSLVRLGYYGQAKNILKRSCQANKYDYQAYKQYENFIAIYGSIRDAVEFRKLRASQKQEEQLKAKTEMDIENPKEIIHVNGNFHKQTEMEDQKHQKQKQKSREKSKQKPREKQKQKQKNKEVKKQSQNQQQIQTKIVESNNKKSVTQSRQKKHIIDNFINRLNPNEPLQNAQDPAQPEQTIEQHPKIKLHTDSGNTLFIKGFPNTFREEEVTQIVKNKDKIKQIRLIEKKAVYQNYCYVEMESAEAAQKQVEENQHKKMYTVAISKPPSLYTEQRTLFLCGLPQTTTVQKIKSLFQDQIEEIADVRLKLDENKNIAYVDFKSAESFKKILTKYSEKALTIDNKKIIIKESSSKPKKQPKVVILKHLAFKATNRDIRQFFQDYTIQDIYIPENQNGRSKGFGFVQFKNENQYKKVLDMKEGQIKGRKFEIVKSDREICRPKEEPKEKRKQIEQKNEEPKQSKHSGNRGREKTNQRRNEQDKVDNNFFSQLFK